MKIGTKVKAVKSMYYVSRDNIYEDFYTQEEIMKMCSKIIEEGDVYELVLGETEFEEWECIEGSMLGEFSDMYFEMRTMIEKGIFVVVD